MIKNKFKNAILVQLVLLGSIFTAPHSNAAEVSQLLNLDIGGTLYNVTFLTGEVPNSFFSYWDADFDGVYGGGSSIRSSAPLYASDTTGVASSVARDAIIAALGSTDSIAGLPGASDGFLIPWNVAPLVFMGATQLRLNRDSNINLDMEEPSLSLAFDVFNPIDTRFAWAVFDLVVVPVPVGAPVALYLVAAGLLGLGAMVIRRKAV